MRMDALPARVSPVDFILGKQSPPEGLYGRTLRASPEGRCAPNSEACKFLETSDDEFDA